MHTILPYCTVQHSTTWRKKQQRNKSSKEKFIVYSFSLAAAYCYLGAYPRSQKFYQPTGTLRTRPFSRTYFTCFAGSHHLLIIPFIRVSIINFNHGE